MTEKAKKSKGMGCLTRLILLVLALFIIVYVGIMLFFPADKVKAEIVARASTMLNRQVELDDVSFSLLPTPGLELTGMRIYNPEDFAGGEFVSIDKLRCGLKIMPLLKSNFEFTEIAIDHPVLRLRKAPDGRVNYSFELDTGGEPIQTPVGPKEKITSEEAAFSAFAFDWAQINNGDIIYTDDSSKYTVTLNNFALKTRLNLNADGKTGLSNGTLHVPSISSELIPNNLPIDLKLIYNANIDFEHSDIVFEKTNLEINGIAFNLESTIRNFTDPVSIFARLTATDVPLEPLLEYVPSSENFDPKQMNLQGTLTGGLESRIELKTERAPHFGGAFSINNMSLQYSDISEQLLCESFELDFTTDSISFKTNGGQLSGKPFNFGGVVSHWDDLKYFFATAGQYDLSGVMPFLDPGLNNELKGQANFNLKVSGQLSSWATSQILGNLIIDRLYYNNDSLTSALERLDMSLTFEKNRIKVDTLYAEYPGVDLSLEGKITNGFAHLFESRKGHEKPYLQFKMYSSNINYDILLPEDSVTATSTSGPVDPPSESQAAGEDRPPSGPPAVMPKVSAPIFIPDIKAYGTFSVDTFVFREIVFNDLSGQLSYERGEITYENTRGKIYGGLLKANGSVDITDMYQPFVLSEFEAKNIEANDFMTQFASLAGHVYGKFNAEGKLAGRGSEPSDFIQSLNATSHINMDEGKVVNFDFIEKLADKFSFKTFEEEQLKNLIADIVIKDGHLLLDGTKVFNRLGDWSLGGTVGFLDKKLNINVSLYLSEKYSKNMNLLGNLLQDDKGRVKVNFNIIGTYDKPDIANISTDNQVVSDNVEEKIKKEANKLLNNLFKKK